ncbi:hypothetical protein P154DRAFT_571275 [Amniculicola lignicola CBS 123094]|uniref:Uncharacterized protein n=1 Tax=Amniculicola lignicola CBS 123094 TaxID=1392246 RepID=A0A6A5WVA9_9PLEO|nr:hypothetical protein P154DRAFT_571275 [Amniculicola lignicola CBS 123094]
MSRAALWGREPLGARRQLPGLRCEGGTGEGEVEVARTIGDAISNAADACWPGAAPKSAGGYGASGRGTAERCTKRASAGAGGRNRRLDVVQASGRASGAETHARARRAREICYGCGRRPFGWVVSLRCVGEDAGRGLARCRRSGHGR